MVWKLVVVVIGRLPKRLGKFSLLLLVGRSMVLELVAVVVGRLPIVFTFLIFNETFFLFLFYFFNKLQ
jgi:hypothetical protein